MYVFTQGFVLRARALKEADRLYVVYTDTLGKIDAQARGVRKVASKLAGHLQPFVSVDCYLAHGKLYYQLIGAVSGCRIQNIEFRMLGYGFYFLELVDMLTRVEQRNERVFQLLTDVFDVLPSITRESEAKRLRIAFLLKLLKATGFSPEDRVTRDVRVQGELARYLEASFFSLVHEPERRFLKELFAISQYALNEVVDQPLQSVRFLQEM